MSDTKLDDNTINSAVDEILSILNRQRNALPMADKQNVIMVATYAINTLINTSGVVMVSLSDISHMPFAVLKDAYLECFEAWCANYAAVNSGKREVKAND